MLLKLENYKHIKKYGHRSSSKTFGLRVDAARKDMLKEDPGAEIPENIYATYDYSRGDRIYDIKSAYKDAKSITISPRETTHWIKTDNEVVIELWRYSSELEAMFMGCFSFSQAYKAGKLKPSIYDDSYYIMIEELEKYRCE